jgi:hypothetical protein
MNPVPRFIEEGYYSGVLVLVGTMKSLVNRTRARGRPYLRHTSAALANCELS